MEAPESYPMDRPTYPITPRDSGFDMDGRRPGTFDEPIGGGYPSSPSSYNNEPRDDKATKTDRLYSPGRMPTFKVRAGR
jgi:hypothetical protein